MSEPEHPGFHPNLDRAPLWESMWWSDVMEDIYGPREGGSRIIIDAQDAATGVGKTSLAVHLAELFSDTFGYDFGPEDMTLSGGEYMKRVREHPGTEQPSVLILDELSGAGAADARRAMSSSNVELGRLWETLRTKRIVTIVTLPHWSDADKKLRKLADYRLWCRADHIGHFVPFDIGAGFEDGGIRTRGYDDTAGVAFPDMTGTPLYEALSEQKDDLLDSVAFDADEIEDSEDGIPSEVREEVREEGADETKRVVAQRLRDTTDMTLEEIGAALGDTEEEQRSRSWVSRATEGDGS